MVHAINIERRTNVKYLPFSITRTNSFAVRDDGLLQKCDADYENIHFCLLFLYSRPNE